MSILQEIYYGNIHPWEKIFAENSELKKTLAKSVEAEETLNELLNDEGKGLLRQIIAYNGEISGVSCMESFIDGFKLAMQISIEVFYTCREPNTKPIGNDRL